MTYNRKVRIPFENKISKHFQISSNELDGLGIHHYHVEALNDAGDVVLSTPVNFQKGVIDEPFNAFNGLLSTVYLTILIDHLDSFNHGNFANDETKQAVNRLKEGLYWLCYRSDERDARGVLGQHKA